MMRELKEKYKSKKTAIKKRLKEFRAVLNKTDKEIFSELCFCICTPQSRARTCGRAISALKESGVLYNGNEKEVKSGLKGVRFPNNKASYIVETRRMFTSGKGIKIKHRVDPDDILATRQWFAENVKGIGYKEASHFLRNIGLGKGLAILDVHILKNLIRHGVIKAVPKSLSRSKYLESEQKVRKFSEKIKIPMDELDILFWSNETGEIFK